jgi:F0F1-type ATP synthase membrane subunit c/vacuolar-type H+-ATPase subunit K
VGVLRIDSSLTGAQVSMDGRPIGSGPMATELFVEPGRYRVEAKTGSELIQRIVDVQAGEERRVQLEPVPKVAVERRHEEPSGKGKVIGAGIAGGLGAVGFAAGITALVLSTSRNQERDQLVGHIFGNAPKGNECTTAQFQTDCNRIGALVDEKYVFQNVAIGGFVVGVAGVATSIALGLSSRRSPAGPKVGTSVMVVPTASGIVVGGKF